VQGRWRIGVHFIPTLLIVALLVPFYALNAVEKRAELDAELAALPYETNVPLIIAAVQMLLYWIVALRVLVRYADSLRDQYAAIERLSFRWLRVMLIVCLAVWAIWIAGQILHLDWAVVPNALAVPLALYMLAYLGLRQPAVFAQRAEAVIVTPTVESAANSSSESKYRRDSLDTTRVSEYLTRLDQLMETEKPWLENELTLSELAQRAGLSTHHLSQLINGQLERTFYDYINERRVREVQRCLRDPAYADEPILQIALAAGFNSKAAFNAAFKQWTGMTPSHYRRTASDSAINATSIRPTGSGVRPDLSAKTTLP
jgi:AraC-like DNA-binding protein